MSCSNICHPCRSGLPSSRHHPLTLEYTAFPCHPADRHRNPMNRKLQVHIHNPRHREPRSLPDDHISSYPQEVQADSSSCRHSPTDRFLPKAPTHGAQGISCQGYPAAVHDRNRFRARCMRMFHRHWKRRRNRLPKFPPACCQPKRLHNRCSWGQSLSSSRGCLFRRNGSNCRRRRYFSRAKGHHPHKRYSCRWGARQC